MDKLVAPIFKICQDYNQMLAIVRDTVYDGETMYQPMTRNDFALLMRAWILRILEANMPSPPSSGGLLAVGDKTPAHSFFVKDMVALFPTARFIHLVRDGRDAAISNYYHRMRVLKASGGLDQLKPLNIKFPFLFAKWAAFTRAVTDCSGVEGISLHTVHYEDLLADGVGTVQSCLQFLVPGHSFSDQDVIRAVVSNAFSVRSGGRAPGVADESSFLRRGVAGGWRSELSPGVLSALDQQDLDVLRLCGYSD